LKIEDYQFIKHPKYLTKGCNKKKRFDEQNEEKVGIIVIHKLRISFKVLGLAPASKMNFECGCLWI